MNYEEFLARVIDEGIDAAKRDYTKPDQKDNLEGSLAGFEACIGKLPNELIEIWAEVEPYAVNALGKNDSDAYWFYRCYKAEVEWVMNVVSAMLHVHGQPPLLSWLPTCNAMSKYASIVGISENK